MRSYVVKEENKELVYSEAIIVDNPSALKIIDHPIRLKILKLLAKTPMYPAELAKELKMHEQKVYYHIKLIIIKNRANLKIVCYISCDSVDWKSRNVAPVASVSTFI